MRPIRSLLLYMAVVFGGGALLAPWLYWLAQAAAGQWPALGNLASKPFPRFLNRSLLGLALLCLYPLLRACTMLHWRDVGLEDRRSWLSGVARGFLLGFGSLAAVALLAVLWGGKSFNAPHSMREILGRASSAALTAVIVAVMEEFIFRGALFGILRKAVTWPEALVWSSAIYAVVHFIQKASFAGPVQLWSGLALLPKMFQAGAFVPMFFTLFLAGSILALAYQRTGKLFFSMGLHAGWIFWLRFYGVLIGGNLLGEWLALPVLAGVFWIVWRMKPAGERMDGV